ncbi:hypothetical protein N9Y89_01405 [bacterium]|nr:hypothetical protein [bacterium]
MEKMILDELIELMQCQKAPSFKNHTSYTKGIPQYGLELDQLILEIGKFENNFPNFHILGNYFNGVSSSLIVFTLSNVSIKSTGNFDAPLQVQ